MDKILSFTVEEMEKCFKAGYDFGKDMFNNPSNSEYINEIILQKNGLNGEVKKLRSIIEDGE